MTVAYLDPQPIPVEEPFFYTRCEHCGWEGSSEQCHVSEFDECEVYCPHCLRETSCDEVESRR